MCLILCRSYLFALPMLRWTLSMDCGSLSNSCFILRCDAVLLGSGCAGEANLRFRVRSWLSPSEVEVVEADGAVEGDGEGAIMIDGEACFVDESGIELCPRLRVILDSKINTGTQKIIEYLLCSVTRK